MRLGFSNRTGPILVYMIRLYEIDSCQYFFSPRKLVQLTAEREARTRWTADSTAGVASSNAQLEVIAAPTPVLVGLWFSSVNKASVDVEREHVRICTT